MQIFFYIVMAFALGALLPLQSAANGQLGRTLGSPYLAALAVFCVAALGMVGVLVGQRVAWSGFAAVGRVPWWGWLGGVLGMANILGFIVLPPKIGISTLIGLFVAGQILSALVLEHFGVLNMPVHPLSAWRVLGALLLITGVVLIKKF